MERGNTSSVHYCTDINGKGERGEGRGGEGIRREEKPGLEASIYCGKSSQT